MDVIYTLVVLAHHNFDRVLHRSAHATRQGATDHADKVVVPALRAKEEPEWRDSIGYEVRDIEFFA